MSILFWLSASGVRASTVNLGNRHKMLIIHCWHLLMSSYHSIPTAQSLQSIHCLAKLHLDINLICKHSHSSLSLLTWHWLMSVFHPGPLSFFLQAASDTLPTRLTQGYMFNLMQNLIVWFSSPYHCPHSLLYRWLSYGLNATERYMFHHDQVLYLLTAKLKGLLKGMVWFNP